MTPFSKIILIKEVDVMFYIKVTILSVFLIKLVFPGYTHMKNGLHEYVQNYTRQLPLLQEYEYRVTRGSSLCSMSMSTELHEAAPFAPLVCPFLFVVKSCSHMYTFVQAVAYTVMTFWSYVFLSYSVRTNTLFNCWGVL